jgi:lipid A disaccharide synthetase
MLVPEFVQTRVRAGLMAQSVAELLDDPAARETLSARLVETTAQMRGRGEASDRAAATVLDVIAQ